jgi:acetyl esterase
MAAAISSESAALVAAAAERDRPSLHLMSPVQARECYEHESGPVTAQPPAHRVTDVVVASGVPARLYHPTDADRLPVVVFLHGGGWVVGSIDTHDRMCRELTLLSGCAVLSVGYRLAPEHPFPAAVDDAVAALAWVRANATTFNLDQGRLAVAGDSAGGNLAVAAALRSRQSGVPLQLQLLFYPVTTTDLDLGIDPEYDGLVLSRQELAWHQDQYLPDRSTRRHAESSPLDCADLAALPPAVIILAECDPIAPQSLRFAEALRAAGVPTTVHIHEGSIHGFAQFPDTLTSARTALAQASNATREALLRDDRTRGEVP